MISNSKLKEDFDIASTHMVLVNANLSAKSVHNMIDEMEQVDGVKYVLGLESVIGLRVPQEILPDSLTTVQSKCLMRCSLQSTRKSLPQTFRFRH